MKLLIVGAHGQLGAELCKCLEHGSTELGTLPQVLRDADVTAVDIDKLDIADSGAVNAFITEGKFDVILNCAAYTNVNGCESNQDDAFRGNALGPKNLAVAAEKIGAKLIHVSTDYVFAGDGTVPYREYDVCAPQSVYGKTKYLGEQYVRELCSRYFIVRTAWLYGYYGNNFVHTMKKLGETKTEITVVNDQRGNPTNAADLAHHLLKLAVTEEYGIYHCTGGGECTWFDFASRIMELYGLPCRVNPCTTDEYPTPAKRPAFSSLDNMMLRNTVGDEMRDWQDALECFIKKESEM